MRWLKFKCHRLFEVNKRVFAVFYLDKNFKNIAVKHEDNQTNIDIRIIPFQAKSIPEIWKYFQASGSEHRNFVLQSWLCGFILLLCLWKTEVITTKYADVYNFILGICLIYKAKEKHFGEAKTVCLSVWGLASVLKTVVLTYEKS